MTTPPRLVIEEATGVPFFEIVGHNGVSNTFVDAPPMAHHEALRVRIVNGSTAYSLAASDLTFVDDDCETHEVVLPAVSLAANGVATYWITASGASSSETPHRPRRRSSRSRAAQTGLVDFARRASRSRSSPRASNCR